MGFLDKVLKTIDSTAKAVADSSSKSVTNDNAFSDGTIHVVGTSHYQDTLWELTGDEDGEREQLYDRNFEAVVSFDPTNQFDSAAIKVEIEGELVGYIGKGDQAAVAPMVKAAKGELELSCFLIGGADGKAIGIRLDIP